MDKFPEFSETTWGQSFIELQVAGIIQTESEKRELLRISMGVYNRVKARWEADQRKSSGDGTALVS